jgi:hypothetical protein
LPGRVDPTVPDRHFANYQVGRAIGRSKGEGRGPAERAIIQRATADERKGSVVAGVLKADLVALHHGSNDMFDAVGEAALDFISHEDGLAEAAQGWIGSSQQALGELATRWEARHTHHKLQAGGLGSHVADAMVSYATTEDQSAQALRDLRG